MLEDTMSRDAETGTHSLLPPLNLPRYDQLPSFGIYVDQLISFVNETVQFSYMPDEKALTASMVNNYVKQGVVPKPEKKKYSRNHIAYLIVVCILKKVFSIQEITSLITRQIKAHPTPGAYDSFIVALEKSLAEVFSQPSNLAEVFSQPSNLAEVFSQPSSHKKTKGDTPFDNLLMDRAVLTFSNKLFVQIKMLHNAEDQKRS